MARVSTWSFNPTPPTSIDYRPRLHSTGIDQAIKGFVKFVFLVFVVCVCVSCSHVFTRCMFVDDREKDERRRRSHSHPGPDYTEQMFLPPGAMRGHHHISRFQHFLIHYSSVTFFFSISFSSLSSHALLISGDVRRLSLGANLVSSFCGGMECVDCVSTLQTAPLHRHSSTPLTCCLLASSRATVWLCNKEL